MTDCLQDSFNQVLVLNSSGSEFSGFINAFNEEFYITLSVHRDGHSKKVNLQGSWRLQHLLHPVKAVLEQHLSSCNTAVEMFHEIKNTVEQQLKINNAHVNMSVPAPDYYKVLLEQLKDCGWDKVHYISTSLDTVHLKAFDSCYREHILHVHLPPKFPQESPKCECELPEEFIFKWTPNKTLLDLYNSFQDCLDKYNVFWKFMDEIDQNVWVLEPEKPSRKECKRRIALAPTASLLIIVNSSTPSAIPVCHFLGPEKIIGPIQENFNSNIDHWDEDQTLLTNLQNVLEIEFPSPTTSAKEELCVECGICYTYQLGDALPDISCNDSSCNQPFHHMCLYEWLRSLPTSRHSFNTVFGECPYCGKPIWCKMP